jgi:hypothetical protein
LHLIDHDQPRGLAQRQHRIGEAGLIRGVLEVVPGDRPAPGQPASQRGLADLAGPEDRHDPAPPQRPLDGGSMDLTLDHLICLP